MWISNESQNKISAQFLYLVITYISISIFNLKLHSNLSCFFVNKIKRPIRSIFNKIYMIWNRDAVSSPYYWFANCHKTGNGNRIQRPPFDRFETLPKSKSYRKLISRRKLASFWKRYDFSAEFLFLFTTNFHSSLPASVIKRDRNTDWKYFIGVKYAHVCLYCEEAKRVYFKGWMQFKN